MCLCFDCNHIFYISFQSSLGQFLFYRPVSTVTGLIRKLFVFLLMVYAIFLEMSTGKSLIYEEISGFFIHAPFRE